MIVYSVQTLEAYYKMREQGYLVGIKEYIWPEFIKPYQWMMNQMEKHMEDYNGTDYPVWLWRTIPDRNHSGHFPKGTKGVILTLDIPED